MQRKANEIIKRKNKRNKTLAMTIITIHQPCLAQKVEHWLILGGKK